MCACPEGFQVSKAVSCGPAGGKLPGPSEAPYRTQLVARSPQPLLACEVELGPARLCRPAPGGQAGACASARLSVGLPVPAGQTPGTLPAWGFEVQGVCLNLPAGVDAAEDVCSGVCGLRGQ